MTEVDVKDLILAVLVEHELIAPPESPQGRINAASREWHREVRAKIDANTRPPGDYCAACASRWCVCADRRR